MTNEKLTSKCKIQADDIKTSFLGIFLWQLPSLISIKKEKWLEKDIIYYFFWSK